MKIQGPQYTVLIRETAFYDPTSKERQKVEAEEGRLEKAKEGRGVGS